MSKIQNITIGADPELFIADKNTGEIVSAEGLIGGTKDEPKPISDTGHAIQEDNVMAEFTIPPAIEPEGFVRDINFAIDYIEEMISNKYIVVVDSSAILDKKYLNTEQARMFGCDPDFCAWTGEINEPPSANSNLRTAGGHIHVGYNNPDMITNENIVKAMDLFLGVPSVIMDDDSRRREMYGKAGAFRPKEYGVEYRSLSNFWIENNDLIRWAFNNTTAAINSLNNGLNINVELSNKIVNCINDSNKELAIEIINEFNIPIIEYAEVIKEHELS